jgi:hypothetical protein
LGGSRRRRKRRRRRKKRRKRMRQKIRKKRTALFWIITQRVVVISYCRFGTTYRSHFQRLSQNVISKLPLLLAS